MLPAARITDMHVCPMWTVVVPHIGGPLLPGEPTVLIGKLPSVRMGDPAVCVGPPDTVVFGSPTVLIGKRPASRLTDLCAHGGVITAPGCPTVLIGGAAAPPPPPPPPPPNLPPDEMQLMLGGGTKEDLAKLRQEKEAKKKKKK